ncbi:MAG: FkbM family methyltransferase [Terriglobia bacterium]
MPVHSILKLIRWWLIHLGPRRDVTIQTRIGPLTVDSQDWLMGKHLYVRRDYESHETQTALALLRDEGLLAPRGGRLVLDVGANIGMTCIGLVKGGDFERAVAFEPVPNTYRLLVQNVGQNGLADRIRHFNCALSSAEGELVVELSRDNSGDNRIRTADAPGAFREERRTTVRVRAMTLDGLLRREPDLRPEEIDAIWLDIQGHEGHFLLGARELLHRNIPVVTEFWPYAIARSGLSQERFSQIVSEHFTHFYLLNSPQPSRKPVSEISALFRTYSRPKAMCQLLLISDQRR